MILLHRDAPVRHHLDVELTRLGYSVLALASDAELQSYLDGAEAYDARVAFPDLLVADELSLGLAGLRRLAVLRETVTTTLPVVLLSHFSMRSVADEELSRLLHIVAVLRPPFPRDLLASTLARALPTPCADEVARRSSSPSR